MNKSFNDWQYHKSNKLFNARTKAVTRGPNMETQIFGFNGKNTTSKKLQIIIFCFLIHCYSTINLISNADLGLMYLLFNLI